VDSVPPCFNSLASVYDDDESKSKYSKLEKIFKETFSNNVPDFYVRAPGRVNLIGEHIDYEGYSVLPMAIARELVLAVSICNSSPSSTTSSSSATTTISKSISLANIDPSFTPTTIPIDPNANIVGPLHWSHYFRCGYKGAWLLSPDDNDTAIKSADNDSKKTKRQNKVDCNDNHIINKGIAMNVLVHGDIPLASGLSSSSALVVASTVATRTAMFMMKADVSNLSGPQLADLCRKAEDYIGTMGGGMDQAISVLGEKGIARLIHFNPVRTEPVKLPANVVVVIADSLTKAEKAKDAKLYYNKRVVECMLAAKGLSKVMGIRNWKQMTTLRQVQDKLNKTLQEMQSLAEQHLIQVGTEESLCKFFDVNNLIDLFQMDDESTTSVANSIHDVLKNAKEYKLRPRAVHVYSEANRVYAFHQVCASGSNYKNKDRESVSPSIEETLGELMNQSQISCRDLYECSSIELDLLTDTCRALGALGSRLTGAGWGGSTVSLVRDNQVDEFIHNLKIEYYAKANKGKIVDDNATNLHKVVFACKAMTGTSIFRF